MLKRWVIFSFYVLVQISCNSVAVEEKFLGSVLVYELARTELHGSGSFVKRVNPFCAINRPSSETQGLIRGRGKVYTLRFRGNKPLQHSLEQRRNLRLGSATLRSQNSLVFTLDEIQCFVRNCARPDSTLFAH